MGKTQRAILWLLARFDAQLEYWARALGIAYSEVNVFGYTLVKSVDDIMEITSWKRRR